MQAEDPSFCSYSTARVPTVAVKYTFSRLSFNSMILLPPPHAADSRPVYHISVNLNVFNPFSFITSVRRGGSPDGDYVGDFE